MWAGGGPAVAESNGGVRVMPLGDSITEGTPVPGGYRIGGSGYLFNLDRWQLGGRT